MRFALTLAAVAALAGCGGSQNPSADAEVTASGAAVRLVDEADADLVLYVSNQSFDDGKVNLDLTIDGMTVVAGDFHVNDQHTWSSYSLTMAPGEHEIVAESDSGATLSKSFKLPGDKTRYAIIEYWTEGGDADLTWQFQRDPVGFG